MQKGLISIFWPIFMFCRIKLIFGRLTCLTWKASFRNFFGRFALHSPELTYTKNSVLLLNVLSKPLKVAIYIRITSKSAFERFSHKDAACKTEAFLHTLFLENEVQMGQKNYRTKLVCQKLTWSCKKWNSAQKPIDTLFAQRPSISLKSTSPIIAIYNHSFQTLNMYLCLFMLSNQFCRSEFCQGAVIALKRLSKVNI